MSQVFADILLRILILVPVFCPVHIITHQSVHHIVREIQAKSDILPGSRGQAAVLQRCLWKDLRVMIWPL